MPATLTTASLALATSECLAWLQELGFTYLKSREEFRRKEPQATSYITINAVTHNRVWYHLAFYLGVRVHAVEEEISRIYGTADPSSRNARTIWCYTVNVGPSSPHWDYSIRGTWGLTALSDFPAIRDELNTFVKDLAVPFVTEHTDSLRIRETLLALPGHAQNLYPYEQILAIDSLFLPPEVLQEDIAELRQRYSHSAPRPLERFHEFLSLLALCSACRTKCSCRG